MGLSSVRSGQWFLQCLKQRRILISAAGTLAEVDFHSFESLRQYLAVNLGFRKLGDQLKAAVTIHLVGHRFGDSRQQFLHLGIGQRRHENPLRNCGPDLFCSHTIRLKSFPNPQAGIMHKFVNGVAVAVQTPGDLFDRQSLQRSTDRKPLFVT